MKICLSLTGNCCLIGFYEPLSFLGVSCLRAAEAACQDAQEKQQNVSLTDTERIRAAEDVSLEWMNSRRTRSCLQLPLLIFTAQRAAAEVYYFQISKFSCYSLHA